MQFFLDNWVIVAAVLGSLAILFGPELLGRLTGLREQRAANHTLKVLLDLRSQSDSPAVKEAINEVISEILSL